MENNNKAIANYYMNGNPDEKMDLTENLLNAVLRKLNKVPNLDRYYFYKISITKQPGRLDYHKFDIKQITDISRQLTNGLSTFSRVPNRIFWNNYFVGAVRTKSIKQRDKNEYPSFSLNYLVYSDKDNLDATIMLQLLTRVKYIDPGLELSMKYLGTYDSSIIKDNLDCSRQESYKQWILENE